MNIYFLLTTNVSAVDNFEAKQVYRILKHFIIIKIIITILGNSPQDKYMKYKRAK